MNNKLDHEIDRLRSDQRSSGTRERKGGDDRLRSLEADIRRVRYAKGAIVDCWRGEGGLNVCVCGQPLAVWRAEGSHLTLYRPGRSSPETHATGTAQAAVFTTRLIAAAWQA